MQPKPNMHPRNLHRMGYDFDQLISSCPELKKFVHENKHGIESINFFDPEAVRVLNKALLIHFYQIEYWELPDQFLCPPIPGRADYLHHLADLLAKSNKGKFPRHDKLLDVGVGASCIYPILGLKSYGWSFVGSEFDPLSFQSAQRIIDKNLGLMDKIELRKQKQAANIFKGIIQAKDQFMATICNPPFHASLQDARAGSKRKMKNLTGNQKGKLNFGGQLNELCFPGGERAFIKIMIEESKLFANQVLWFSSLVSKASSLEYIYQLLKGVPEIETLSMGQGNKQSRIVAWSFYKKDLHQRWFEKQMKS